MKGPVAELRSQEMNETPGFLRENGERVHALAEQLVRDFGGRLRLELVGLDSPRGLWLGVRHGVGKDFAVVVAGREVFRSPTEYGPLRAAVERALESRERPGAV